MAEESGEATVLGKDSQSATLAFLDAVKYGLFLNSRMKYLGISSMQKQVKAWQQILNWSGLDQFKSNHQCFEQ